MGDNLDKCPRSSCPFPLRPSSRELFQTRAWQAGAGVQPPVLEIRFLFLKRSHAPPCHLWPRLGHGEEAAAGTAWPGSWKCCHPGLAEPAWMSLKTGGWGGDIHWRPVTGTRDPGRGVCSLEEDCPGKRRVECRWPVLCGMISVQPPDQRPEEGPGVDIETQFFGSVTASGTFSREGGVGCGPVLTPFHADVQSRLRR